MAYTHNNRVQLICAADPIDANDGSPATDWVFFSYQDWLREWETISAHSASITGGTIITNSTDLGIITDSLGVSYTDSYGVEFSPTEGASKVSITHRVSTTVSGSPDLGRTNIDHTVIIPVRAL